MEPLRPTRRTLTRTAAWTVPVVAVATAAPAFAASPCNCPEFYFQSFPSGNVQGGNGWTITATGGTSGGGTDQFTSSGFVTVADPRAGFTRTVTANRSICVTQGRTYTFTYPWTAYVDNTRPMTSVMQINSVTIAGSTIDTSDNQKLGTKSLTWVANTTGNVNLAFVHTTQAPAGIFVDTFADDITITTISGTCA